jgi:exodeoxyribonuclease VII large subunit
LPFLPRAVGVVTSAVGAARRDIEAVVHRRSPQIPIIISPSNVEGLEAAPHIVRALERLACHPEVDVIIVGRGGGSIESLGAFNTEAVVRAIAACPVPVISAVGHETDTTLADLVADLRAPTPSAAAERAVPERDDLLAHVDALAGRLDGAVLRGVARWRERLGHLGKRLSRGLAFDARHRTIEALRSRLDRATGRSVQSGHARLNTLTQRLATQHPRERISRARAALQLAAARLGVVGPLRTQTGRRDVALLAARLHALSPLGSLQRGYSLTRTPDGQVVQRASQVAVGDTLHTQLASGALTTTVTAVHPDSTPATGGPSQES